jgi:hypothetical protein
MNRHHTPPAGTRVYLPKMQRDVETIRRIYQKLNAEPLFEQHVLRVLDYAVHENIVTASEVEAGERLNRRVELLILCHHVRDVSSLPWRGLIAGDMADYLALHKLDLDPRRDWSDYATLLRKPDSALPLAVLAVLAEKALCNETLLPSFYGVTEKSAPGIRMPRDWEADRKAMAEPDLVVYRKLANLFGYRETYNRIGAHALESLPDFAALLREVRMDKARLAGALKRTGDAVSKLISRVCDELTRLGVPYRVEVRGEKGEASQALKLRERRSRGDDLTVAETHDSVAVRLFIGRAKGAMTENLGGVRIAENVLFRKAGMLSQAGLFPYMDVSSALFIAKPKPNGYRSDHYDFKLVADGERNPRYVNVEVQVLTEEMYEFNTHGGAAHIAYKDAKDYAAVAGMGDIRSVLLRNYQRLIDDIEGMQGRRRNGANPYSEFPAAAVRPDATASIRVERFDGNTAGLEVMHQEGDLALDILARSGLDLRSHAVAGRCSDRVLAGQTVVVVQKPDAMNPQLARALHKSSAPFNPFTLNKLAEIFRAEARVSRSKR